jgi:hypothetical protein
MDVHCSSCNEPWDTHHLWQDAIWETGLDEAEIAKWKTLPTVEKLNDPYRREFKAAGYVFGRSVINVIHCPACPPDAKPDADKVHLKAKIESMLGEDEDGLAAHFEDLQL